MSNEFSDLILTICPHEQANAKVRNRVDSIQSFFESRGTLIEFAEINILEGYKTSMDYALSGSYNGKEISLAISAKTMVDFSATIGKLKDELARGYLRFDDVGFILVTGCYQTSLADGSLHAIVTNPGATAKNQDDRANVLNLTSMFNALESWQMCGIHCRQVLYEEDFPKAIMSIITYISKDHHEGIGFDTKQFSGAITKSKQELKAKLDFVNTHLHLGVEGFGVKTALKLREYLILWNYPPNLHFATSLDEVDLQEAVGNKTGSALFQAYNSRYGYVKFQSNVANSNPKPSQATPRGELTPKSSNTKQSGAKSLKSPLNRSGTENITKSNNNPCGKLCEDANAYECKGVICSKHPDYKEKIISCNFCGVDSDCAYVNPETMLCQACQSNEDYYEIESKKEIFKSQLPEEHISKDSVILKEVNAASQSLDAGHVSGNEGVLKSGIHDTSLQVSKGKADELSMGNISPLEEDNKQTVRTSFVNKGIENLGSEREVANKPHCSRSADLHDISQSCSIYANESHTHKDASSSDSVPVLNTHDTFQSSSTEQHSNVEIQAMARKDISVLGTHDTFQSSAGHHLLAVDPAEGTILRNRSSIQSPKPSVGNFHEVRVKETIKSLEDAVVDYVYEAPKSDTEVMNSFMMRGFKMPEIHKIIKESSKLRKYKQGNGVMVAFHGVRADVPLDVGV